MGEQSRARRRRFDDDDPYTLKRRRRAAPALSDVDDPPDGDAWTSWDASGVLHGPEPFPDWVVTELAAVDRELGVLKTGKEADVHLVERGVPGTDRSCLLAAKRYRDSGHRMFHRDAGYLEGRRMRRSRENRAMATRTAFGKQIIAGQWAFAEFGALTRLWQVGLELGVRIVPYPVQLLGTELMLEFLGGVDGDAAPRLAELRPDRAELARYWDRLVDALVVLARAGYAHGDLSPYNILVQDGELILIDLPQVVDVVSNPQGREFLVRDVRNVCTWFASRGRPDTDPERLLRNLLEEAGMR